MIHKGFTLIEVMMYIAFSAIIGAVVMTVFISENKSWAYARATRDASDTGKLIMERVIHEVRLAKSVDIGGSLFNVNPGRLKLETFSSATSTQSETLEIFLDGTELKLQRGANPALSLSGSYTTVTNLVFRRFASTKSTIIRVELSVKSSVGTTSVERSFISASVLRGAY